MRTSSAMWLLTWHDLQNTARQVQESVAAIATPAGVASSLVTMTTAFSRGRTWSADRFGRMTRTPGAPGE